MIRLIVGMILGAGLAMAQDGGDVLTFTTTGTTSWVSPEVGVTWEKREGVEECIVDMEFWPERIAHYYGDECMVGDYELRWE